jgi:hypothetical protein
MPSPFPGMDPYLEQEVIWHDFHERFLPAVAAHLSHQVLPRYIVLIDEHVYLYDVETETHRPVGRSDLAVATNSGRFAAEPRGVSLGIVDAPVHVRVPDVDDERELSAYATRCQSFPSRFVQARPTLSSTFARSSTASTMRRATAFFSTIIRRSLP